MKTDELLEQRGKIHGDYSDGLYVRGEILNLLENHAKEAGSPMEQQELIGFLDIVNKLVRASANRDHLDNWDDLAGYSILMKTHKEKESIHSKNMEDGLDILKDIVNDIDVIKMSSFDELNEFLRDGGKL